MQILISRVASRDDPNKEILSAASITKPNPCSLVRKRLPLIFLIFIKWVEETNRTGGRIGFEGFTQTDLTCGAGEGFRLE
jgi:hypothetical protein